MAPSVAMLGLVATTHVATRGAHPEMNPAGPGQQTFLASVGVWPDRGHFGGNMGAIGGHGAAEASQPSPAGP